MPHESLHQCLAVDRQGKSCFKQPYQHSVLDFWRRSPITRIFCREHDDEYCLLLNVYKSARRECRAHRRLFHLTIDDLRIKTVLELQQLRKPCENALVSLDQAIQIRTLRSLRFAAAYDEYANDETVVNLAAYSSNCVKILRYCLGRISSEQVAHPDSWLRMLYCLLVGTDLFRNKAAVSDSELISASSRVDLAAQYFGSFANSLSFVRQISNLSPIPVPVNIRHPLRAQTIAIRATFRNKLDYFLVTNSRLLEKVGHDRLCNIQQALYRRLIIEDRLMLERPNRYSLYTINDFLDLDLVSHCDLKRLWHAASAINPGILRDVLLDLEHDSMCTTISRDSKVCSRVHEPPSMRNWTVLNTILGESMKFSDVYFLSTSAREFLQVSRLALFHRDQFSTFLPTGDVGLDPLLLCMKVLGLYVTYWSRDDDREVLVGLLEDNAITRSFVGALGRLSATNICATFANGDAIHNSESRLARENCAEASIRVNLQEGSGESVQNLYTRTGLPYRDGIELELSRPYDEPLASTHWRLEILHMLALHQTGKHDVCDALDDTFEAFHRQYTEDMRSKQPQFSGLGRNAAAQSVMSLKNDVSQITLTSRWSADITSTIFDRSLPSLIHEHLPRRHLDRHERHRSISSLDTIQSNQQSTFKLSKSGRHAYRRPAERVHGSRKTHFHEHFSTDTHMNQG